MTPTASRSNTSSSAIVCLASLGCFYRSWIRPAVEEKKTRFITRDSRIPPSWRWNCEHNTGVYPISVIATPAKAGLFRVWRERAAFREQLLWKRHVPIGYGPSSRFSPRLSCCEAPLGRYDGYRRLALFALLDSHAYRAETPIRYRGGNLAIPQRNVHATR